MSDESSSATEVATRLASALVDRDIIEREPGSGGIVSTIAAPTSQ